MEAVHRRIARNHPHCLPLVRNLQRQVSRRQVLRCLRRANQVRRHLAVYPAFRRKARIQVLAAYQAQVVRHPAVSRRSANQVHHQDRHCRRQVRRCRRPVRFRPLVHCHRLLADHQHHHLAHRRNLVHRRSHQLRHCRRLQVQFLPPVRYRQLHRFRRRQADRRNPVPAFRRYQVQAFLRYQADRHRPVRNLPYRRYLHFLAILHQFLHSR